MLNDTKRNELYEEAIKRACREVQQRQSSSATKRLNGLDIGSGTGLLAMISAKYLATDSNDATKTGDDSSKNEDSNQQHNKDFRIISLEMSSVMCELAKLTISSNGFNERK